MKEKLLKSSVIRILAVLFVILTANAVIAIEPASYFIQLPQSRDSVILLVSRRGYEVDVLNPGRYVVVKNFTGKRAEGKVRVLNRSTLIVGHTIVPVRHIRTLTVKSTMYPVSRAIFNAGKNLAFKFTGKMFSKLGFSSTGPAAVLLLIIGLLVAIVFVVLGLLLMFIALPGLLTGKTYSTRRWKIYIKPRR